MDVTKNYNEVEYSEKVVQMFSELIQLDRNNAEILFYIARKFQAKETTTIADISENVIGERRVRVKDKNGYHYETVKSNLDRKAVEKVVDRLMYAGLIYQKNELPHKFIYLTIRGVQVIKYISTTLNSTGDGVNG